MKPSLIVYKASAGSGKTFTLALQYIKTLLEQESRHTYSHILAVTFTNKATAEMKDRILQTIDKDSVMEEIKNRRHTDSKINC